MNLTDYPTRVSNRWLMNDPPLTLDAYLAMQQIEREAAAWKRVAELMHYACSLDELQAAHDAFDALKAQLTKP